VNNYLKYKIDTAEIVAFIIGVLLTMGTYRAFYADTFYNNEPARMIATAAILAFFATLYGPVAGVLIGFLGVICALAICGLPFNFVEAISFAIFGFIVGFFANRFYIREGEMKIKQIIGWNLVHVSALMTVFVFILPFARFIVYNRELFSAVSEGIYIVKICAIPIGLTYSLFFHILCRFFRYVNYRP